ncbi:sensor histidine kinase [Streptosporangium canum]|uniref:sensor histidine kinase n=1 Tax=Streptosporangium canum TaxID=324952 RepID=UPI00378C0121
MAVTQPVPARCRHWPIGCCSRDISYNTRKHAGPARASVQLTYGQDRVTVEVRDDGGGPPPQEGASSVGPGGYGLIGMRERVALHGGTLTVGPQADRGFAVMASAWAAARSGWPSSRLPRTAMSAAIGWQHRRRQWAEPYPDRGQGHGHDEDQGPGRGPGEGSRAPVRIIRRQEVCRISG